MIERLFFNPNAYALEQMYVLVTVVNEEQILTRFTGKDVPGALTVLHYEYVNDGKNPHDKWEVALNDGVEVFTWSKDPFLKEYVVSNTWQDAIKEVQQKINSIQLIPQSIERFIRTELPETAERLDNAGKLTTEQHEALTSSIEHWRGNVERVKAGLHPIVGSKQCACCKLVGFPETGLCDGCPIYEYTGRPNCKGTPYDSVLEALRRDNTSMLLEACEAEYQFLCELSKGEIVDQPDDLVRINDIAKILAPLFVREVRYAWKCGAEKFSDPLSLKYAKELIRSELLRAYETSVEAAKTIKVEG